ncbi:MAG TPA: SH3 domain-containing protein [Caldimonas sp.]|nr:SH3 domain-containing protein [Caldimonas sp.]
MRSCLALSLFVGMLCSLDASAGAADDPLPERWTNASEVNLRSEPGGRGAVVALLPLGTSVRWIAASDSSGFCEVDVAGLRGFVACRFLSASSPTPPNVASGGTTGARWVTGAGVVLRAEPSIGSAVVARLGLNARVELLAPAGDSAYCEVATGVPGAAGAHGYTACRYLAPASVATGKIFAPLLPDGQPNPSYDPVRAFWLAPSWARLEAYGVHIGEALKARTATPAEKPTPAERPADAELDRMKAHLAQGIYAPRPAPLPLWDDIKRLGRVAAAPTAPSGVAPDARQRTENARADARFRLAGVLALGSPPFDLAQGGGGRLAGLVGALELPAIRPSLFKDASEVAPPGASVEDLSGRFHIIHTYRTRGRDLGGERGTVDGLWDIGQVTVALTQPVVRTTVFRDGRLPAAVVRASDTRILWGSVDGPMCDGYVDGFAHGAADAAIWRYFGDDFQPDAATLKRNAPGTLLSISTRHALPASEAPPVVASHALDRERTGFARGTWLHFDLDADGVVDLAVWEGTGLGPGHLGEAPKTDAAYYRLFFANIAGRWHVLGTDVFGYGCGC